MQKNKKKINNNKNEDEIFSIINEKKITLIDRKLKELNIKYQDQKQFLFFVQALTHASYANIHKINSYEILEFYGDAIIQFLSTDYIIKRKGLNEIDAQFGTKLRSICVNKQALSFYSQKLGLNECLITLNEEENKYNENICEDIFESFVGAIYINNGITDVKKFLNRTIFKLIDQNRDKESEEITDYKTRFQEIIQSNQNKTDKIKYECSKEENENWTCNLIFNSMIFGTGTGPRKKDAEQIAASIALKKLKKI